MEFLEKMFAACFWKKCLQHIEKVSNLYNETNHFVGAFDWAKRRAEEITQFGYSLKLHHPH